MREFARTFNKKCIELFKYKLSIKKAVGSWRHAGTTQSVHSELGVKCTIIKVERSMMDKKRALNCLFFASSSQRQRHASSIPAQSLSPSAYMNCNAQVWTFPCVCDSGTRLTRVNTQILTACSCIGCTATIANNHRIAHGLHVPVQTSSS